MAPGRNGQPSKGLSHRRRAGSQASRAEKDSFDHCQVTHWTRKTTRLTTERFILILRQLPMLRQIKLQGMGEPLLNRHLIEMLEEEEMGG